MKHPIIVDIRCANVESCMWVIWHVMSNVYLCWARRTALSLPQCHHSVRMCRTTRDVEWITLTYRYYHDTDCCWVRNKKMNVIYTHNWQFHSVKLINIINLTEMTWWFYIQFTATKWQVSNLINLISLHHLICRHYSDVVSQITGMISSLPKVPSEQMFQQFAKMMNILKQNT